MHRSAVFFLALCGLLVVAGPSASARQVFLNGVNLSSVELPEVNLKGCDVHIDARGNIHITARGYKIQVDDKAAPTTRPEPARPSPERLSPERPGSGEGTARTMGESDGRYFLVSFFNRKGATQYDIEVFINGQMVQRIRARSDQVARDITRFIKRGQRNEVIFVARKAQGQGARISESPMDYFRVVLGSGFESKGQIVLKHSLLETRRTAAETRESFTEKHMVILR